MEQISQTPRQTGVQEGHVLLPVDEMQGMERIQPKSPTLNNGTDLRYLSAWSLSAIFSSRNTSEDVDVDEVGDTDIAT